MDAPFAPDQVCFGPRPVCEESKGASGVGCGCSNDGGCGGSVCVPTELLAGDPCPGGGHGRRRTRGVRTLARLAIAATSEKPDRAVEDLAASAADYPRRKIIVGGVSAISNPELSARFFPFASNSTWADVRLDLFALFSE